MNTTDRAMSLADAAAFLERGTSAVRIYLRCEGLPAHRVGRNWVIMESELREWASRPEVVDMMARGTNMLRKTKRLAARTA